MTRTFSSLVTRITVVCLVQLVSMAGVMLLVSWASFDPAAKSGLVRHAELCVINMVTSLLDPKALKEEADSLAAAGISFAVYDDAGSLLHANQSQPIAALSRHEQAQVGQESELIRRGVDPVFARSLRLPSGHRGFVLFSPPPFNAPIGALLPGLLLALLASTVGAVLLARSLSWPLRKLSLAAKQLGSGDLSARVGLPPGDELGDLGAAFDEMAERLRGLVRAQQELLANVSHELRTPLARVQAALDVASEAGPELAKRAFSDINEDLAELERLVADVLQTARLDLATERIGSDLPLARKARLTARSWIEASVARFRHHYGEAALEAELAVCRETMLGDQVLLRRMLDNLLDNAHKYSPPCRCIRLSAEPCDEGQLLLTIEDDGSGISPEDLEHVGRPFFRADRSRARKTGGLGLGVSLARRIAQTHGGSLAIESEVGKGTQVSLVLPLLAAPEPHRQPAPTRGTAPAGTCHS